VQSPASNVHLPFPPPPSTAGFLASPQPGNVANSYFEPSSYGSLSLVDVGAFQCESSEWGNELLKPTSNVRPFPTGNDLNGPNGAISNYSALEYNTSDLSYVRQPPSTVSNQHSAPYPAYESDELGPLIPTSDRSTPSFPLQTLDSQLSREPRGRKRKQGDLTDVSGGARSPQPKRKRGPFATVEQKRQTAVTREVGACIRCSRQRIRVSIIPHAKHSL
jgi:hypothetical protein